MGFFEGKKLGFGCMRLPVLDRTDQTSFDYSAIEALVDTFIERGFRYFDTAYTYHGYKAEKAIKKVLVDRYPRNSFELATKMPLRDFKDAKDLETIFNEQLQNCGVEYFDYYLLHNMGHNVYEKCRTYDVFGFVKKQQAEGKIKYVGMSFHDMPELLEEILSQHADVLDFVQLQINYIDWEQPNVQSKKCLAIANKYNKPVIVMEPCKGGTLVNIPEKAEQLMRAFNPEASVASWALRYAASQAGVFRVLSGMNQLEQVIDNTDTFMEFIPLTEQEYEVLDKVVKIINSNTAIACTACEYCTHDCPKNIPIPQYFALFNSMMRTSGSFSSQMVYYNNIVVNGHGKASDCIRCGKCEQACPQHLTIRTYLEDVVAKFEKDSILPVRRQP
ncbi:MAG: aldo/keto reductase [Lachnospiraceae bacterium]